jgi:hypothetical protein
MTRRHTREKDGKAQTGPSTHLSDNPIYQAQRGIREKFAAFFFAMPRLVLTEAWKNGNQTLHSGPVPD